MASHFKVSVIGAGNVGASTAQRLAERGDTDVVLLDVIDGLPQGKALDIRESAPIVGFDSDVTGTNRYVDTADSDLVVITSGAARKPRMTRSDLIAINKKIIQQVVQGIVKYSPDCVILVTTNPVDVMEYLVVHESKFPRSRVIGLSGILDGTRIARFIADELKVSVLDISPCILGEHGQHMVVVPRLTTVNGIPLTRLLSAEGIQRIIHRTVNGGDEIVELLKTGSAFFAPSMALSAMAEAVLLNKRRLLSCTVKLEGEYGLKNVAIDVPIIFGKGGIEQIVELDLTKEELEAVHSSARAVRDAIAVLGIEGDDGSIL